MLKDKKIQLACSELAYIELGEAETAVVTVVFLHGWLDNAASFSTLLELCHQQLPNAHILAFDFPGHGLSSYRGEDNFYPFYDYIDDVYQLVAKITSNKLVIVGHSLGALVGCCYSAAFPEQVSGLVQIEGFGPISEREENTATRLRKGVLSRRKVADKRQRRFASLEDMVSLRATINRLTEQQILPIVRRGSHFDGEGWRWRHDPKLQSDSLYRMSHRHADVFMEGVTCPQVIILGEKGFDYLNEQAKRYLSSDRSAGNPMMRVEIIAGGHHCHLQQPKLTSNIIADLVNKI